jgi:hypothetical protein
MAAALAWKGSALLSMEVVNIATIASAPIRPADAPPAREKI